MSSPPSGGPWGTVDRSRLDEAIHVAGQLSRRDVLRMAGCRRCGLAARRLHRGTRGAPRRLPSPARGTARASSSWGRGSPGSRPPTGWGRRVSGAGCSRRATGWAAVAGARGTSPGARSASTEVSSSTHATSTCGCLAEELGLRLDDLQESVAPRGDVAELRGRRAGATLRPVRRDGRRAIGDLVELAGTGSYFPGEAAPDIVALDERSEADWYEENVGSRDSATYRLWSANQAGWYGLEPEALSAANLIDFYATGTRGADERYTVHGGNDQVPARTPRGAPRGDRHAGGTARGRCAPATTGRPSSGSAAWPIR